jgi:penicillin amidase
MDKEIFNITDGKTYVLRWTMFEPTENSGIFDAILDINLAKTAEDVTSAAKRWSVPGQNLVFATVDGDIGYQYTGFAPVRKVNGSGVLPQNGSDSNFGWNGYVPYSDHYRVINPSEGYFVTANAKVDKTDNFYITDLFATDHRTDRILEMIEEGEDFTVDDMLKMQSDVVNLYADDILDPLLSDISTSSSIASTALEFLTDWDRIMDKESVGAMIFATFRIYLEEFTFKDEIDLETNIPYLYEKYATYAPHAMPLVANNTIPTWFDDVSTPGINETRGDIASKAFTTAIEFLTNKLGSEVSKWKWGRLHKVIFEHPIGSNAPLIDFNEGYAANNGSSFTVKAAGGSPSWSEDGPEFEQTNGQSMRFIAEVEGTWAKVSGIVSPGESGHYGNEHRADSTRDWINTVNHAWDFSTTRNSNPTFTFRKK